jgi:hypothetical protein
MSFIELLKANRQALEAKRQQAEDPGPDDPWLDVLRTIEGKINPHDGVEQIYSADVFERLGVPRAARGKQFKRLTNLMPEAGWIPVTQRGLGVSFWIRYTREREG